MHADKDGNLAVVAVMFSEGAANPLLASLWKAMPAKEGEKKALADPLSAMQMLPAQRHYYRFTELSDDAALLRGRSLAGDSGAARPRSKAQIDEFTKAMGHPNNRPVQPLNARQVLSQ